MQVTAMGLRFLYSEKIRDIPAGRNSRQPHTGHHAAFRGVTEGLSCAVRCPDRKPDKACDQHRHRLPADSLQQHERGIHASRLARAVPE